MGINISIATIWKLCRDKSQRFGYLFSFSDELKYATKVPSRDGELWKVFCETPHGTKYLVSNQSRIKSVRKNGNEKILAQLLNGGYMHVGNIPPYYVHRAV
eukprot:103619_1